MSDTFVALGAAVISASLPVAVLSGGFSSAVLGSILAARTVSSLSCLPLGGYVGDRFPRVPLMRIALALQVGAVGLLGVVVSDSDISRWIPVGAAVILGVADALFLPPAAALVPTLSRSHNLARINALLTALQSIARVLGPAIAGIMILAWGSLTVIYFGGICYGVALCSVLLLRLRSASDLACDVAQGDSNCNAKLAALGDDGGTRPQHGLRTWRALLPVSLLTLVFNVSVWGPYQILAPAQLSAASRVDCWPWVAAAYGLGSSVFGVLGMFRRSESRYSVKFMGICMLAWSAPAWVVASGGGSALILSIGSVVAGFASGYFRTRWSVYMQSVVPTQLLSRAVSGTTIIASVGLAVGSGGVPLMMQTVGLKRVLFYGILANCVACIVFNAWIFFRPDSDKSRDYVCAANRSE
ncbi:MFS transporter [Luteococcus sp. OSA5]|uniref:MFS transporter n=1 Tax=Luteococcus sp. OSA5 TaxID=3401630 RepID=UPI003B428295